MPSNLVYLTLRRTYDAVPEAALPGAVLCCDNCGNTVIINLYVPGLGLKHILGLEEVSEAKAGK